MKSFLCFLCWVLRLNVDVMTFFFFFAVDREIFYKLFKKVIKTEQIVKFFPLKRLKNENFDRSNEPTNEKQFIESIQRSNTIDFNCIKVIVKQFRALIQLVGCL